MGLTANTVRWARFVSPTSSPECEIPLPPTRRKKNTMLGSTFQKALGVVLAAFIAVGVPAARAQVCINDLQGPDDEPGQKDLSQFCRGGACAGLVGISWNFDDTRWTGSNTGDGCAL